MAQVVLDSNNLEAILADARGPEEASAVKPSAKDGEKKPAEAAKKPAEGETVDAASDADDVEGEDGITPRQKRELSAKMVKAIGKKHRQMMEAEEFAAAQYSEKRMAEERAANLQRQIDELKAKSAPAEKQEVKPKPERQNFGTEGEFIEALTDYKVGEALAAKAKQDAEKEEQERQAAILEAASARIGRALELVPDFREVTEAIDEEVPPAVSSYMQESEMFAELGYFFAKNPAELRAIQKMKPVAQLVAVGKIEAKLQPFAKASSDAAVKTNDGATPSNDGKAKATPSEETGFSPRQAREAAPVIKPINGEGTALEPDVSAMSTREQIQDWQRKNKANFGLRKRH